jgi:sulfite exporter TauE/SafE
MLFHDAGILLSAFLLGLLGSGHCLGMCGGLSSALGLNSREHAGRYVLSYNLGRIFSYSLAGLIVGSLGFWLSKNLAALDMLRYLAALMLILMGFYLGKWFNGLIYFEKLGHTLWPLIQPLSKRFMPVSSIKDALLVGMVWGWLPCGLVYSALIWASLESNSLASMLIMLCFGLGTLPAMLATGLFAQGFNNFVKKPWFRQVAGSLMILFGIWTLPVIQQAIHHLVSR